jgi:hypothetical protein
VKDTPIGYLLTLAAIVIISLLVFIAYVDGPTAVKIDPDVVRQAEFNRRLDEIDQECGDANDALDALSKELDRLEKGAGVE